ncbi:ABC transporter permease [Timonella sp. A28]|uniref:ABC transporter permease n=1 Tax=Timonella sp. A28 TaxID=3442640 RepID=UPI003EB7C3B1
MFNFIFRRALSSFGVLLVATFLIYLLVDFAIDPLEDLRASTAPNKEALIQARITALQLDVPAPVRYLGWLGGVAGCFVGKCDLGTAWTTNQDVMSILGSSLGVTLKLVLIATILAMLLGITVGVVSALRQYTGFDYTIIFISFLLYSLPSFWVAVLLKQWGAIGFNDFLADPTLSVGLVLGLSVLAGGIWQAVVAGDAKRRLIVFGSAFALNAAILWYISATGWLNNPSLGPVVIAITAAGAAFGLTALMAGLRNRKALYAALTTALLAAALWYPMQFAFVGATAWSIAGLTVAFVAAGFLIGWLFGGYDRAISMRVSALVGLLSFGLLFVDRVMQAWKPYFNSSAINGRPIATIGSETPGLKGSFWTTQLDSFTHLILPSTVLILVSFALYTRYSRASMLEVMNQDYVRTARAKGLTERVVLVRHAFRNALIPLATIIPLDFAGILGGAVITERIFGWRGMGTMFLSGLDKNEIEPVMAYVLVIGTVAIVANFIVDLLYAVLDPRIRVNA